MERSPPPTFVELFLPRLDGSSCWRSSEYPHHLHSLSDGQRVQLTVCIIMVAKLCAVAGNFRHAKLFWI